VDPQSIAIRFVLDVDPSFIERDFIPKYEAVFGDWCAENSTDDRPVPELSNRDKTLLQRVLAEHAPDMLDCRDLNQAHRVVADGLRFDDSVPLINHDNVIIRKGIIFKTMEAMKIWLVEYAVFHHHPFIWLNTRMRISATSSFVIVVMLEQFALGKEMMEVRG
jgi:hypothetical protein